MFKLSSIKSQSALKIYFTTFIAFIIISSILIYLFTPSFDYATTDSIKFFLSSLIESESTVIAIVITLSLVVIELTSSNYSTRVVDIFKESRIIWVIIGIYITSIVYGLTVLKFIDPIAASGISNYETSIWISYLLSLFAFGTLIIYFLNALDVMKSSTVINIFAERITNENILSSVSLYEKLVGDAGISLNYSFLYSDAFKPVIETDDDPIQPIIDIIHSSMMKYDYGTTRYGLKVLKDYIIKLLENGKFGKEESIVTKHILTHLERVGRLAARREDEDSVEEVVTMIFIIGESAIKHGIENVASDTVNSIKNIGRSVIKNEGDMQVTIVDLMAELGRESVEKKLEFVTSIIINSLGIIGREASKHAQQGLEETVWMAGYIQEITKLSVKYGLKRPIFYAVNSIGDLGKYTARNDLPKTTIKIINYLKELGLISLEENMNDNANNSVNYLGDIGRIAVWSELNTNALDKLLDNLNEALKIIRDKALEKNVTKTVSTVNFNITKIEELVR